jgi:putative ABC transport system permease protein
MPTELRQALRALARSPGFTAVAIMTLALGIGAETAIYSVVRGVLLRPLPFAEPEELLTICETNPQVAGYCIASPPTVADWAEQSETLEAIGLGRTWPMLWNRPEEARGVDGGLATPGLFRALGVQPALGRLLADDDLAAGAPRVVLVSHALWRDELGGRPEAVGALVTLDGEPHRVVGVLPAGFDVPRLEGVELWTPLPFSPRDEENRGWRGFAVLARMAEGRRLEEVASELAVVQARLARQYPETYQGWGVRVEGLHDHLVGGVRTTLLLFLGAVALVLLVAAANVAHLILARATVRRRELAVRTALGASRRRLTRLALAEGGVLSLAACAVGVLLAFAGTRLFLDLAPAGIPRLDQVRLDGGVLAFAVVLAAVTSVLFAALPAASLADRRLGALLHEVSAGEGPSRTRLRGLLVVAEVAIAVTLLAGAGLLARSFVNLLTWDPGFERAGLLTVPVFSSQGKYPRGEDVLRAHEAAAEAVAALPGVRSVGLASAGPLFGGRETASALPAGGGAAEEGLPVRWYDVGPRYFATLGVPVVRGRGITAQDRQGRPAVALVNETAARRLWPGRDAVGERLRIDWLEEPFEVVGVVRDVPPLRRGEPVEPEVYWPYAQLPRWAVFLVIRADGDPAALVQPAEARLEALDPDLQIGRWATLAELADRELRQPRFTLLLVALFAAVAAALAAVGIYGLLAYAVACRTREIGVRMALGAERRRIEAGVVAGALRLTAAGLVLGLAGAAAAGRGVRSLLHGIAPTDPWTLAAVALLVLGVAVLASWLPARRAGAVDPIKALRRL